jgi:hypothetical protein
MVESQPVKPEGKKKKYEEYEVDSAVETLIRAEEIKHNPPLMALVQKKIAKKKRAISSIDDLKTARDESFKDDED